MTMIKGSDRMKVALSSDLSKPKSQESQYSQSSVTKWLLKNQADLKPCFCITHTETSA